MSQAWSGVIMALDNILALFLLPLFGAISDKHTGKRGRRTPFIVLARSLRPSRSSACRSSTMRS